ncbi:MAG: hypothetical protein AAF356_10370 [Planctomycetota bacterium]
MNRRGALLLELILALGLLAAGAMAVFASLSHVSAQQETAANRLAAADLAHSAAALLEAGLASPTNINGQTPWPADLLAIESTPDGSPPLGLRTFWVEASLDDNADAVAIVRVFGPLGPGTDAAPLAETIAVLPRQDAT